jgi:low affinity Fe/Cu permease
MEDYEKYLRMLVAQPQAPAGISTVVIEKKLDEILKEMKEGVRSVVTLWKQKVA